jgi:hypothetical protein
MSSVLSIMLFHDDAGFRHQLAYGKEPAMSHEIIMEPEEVAPQPALCRSDSSSIFLPFEQGWKPARLPELATNGFPFAPPFIVRAPVCSAPPDAGKPSPLPFGFRFRVSKTSATHPVIDLTHGFYDPVTQLYTVPLRAGGDTEGDEFETGYWTDHGDGKDPNKSWDTMTDRESD